ncbi:hypothetical protein GCM10027515_16470 [Schumannella luteola]|uniref:Molecular chaperone GrpE (Heat shock protein) n=1 Tax=Schumannella luteola TaxID=472059 RepID=A0A852YDE7_9MICO|nr:hypothetical protein [Schumannella luteola]NYH00554.1 molecular chaperone GrpE (heat shock protein) [Schumannella luteola]TPW91021.1 hypothetical protein FJ656_36275 [Schumannella luteola]
MVSSRRLTVAALSVATLSIALLAGCAGGQSKAEACASLKSVTEKTNSELSSASSDIASDPSKAADTIDTFKNEWQKATDKIQNPDVKKSAQKAVDSLDDFSKALAERTDDPTSTDTSGLMDAATGAQKAFTDLGTLCSKA